MSSSESCPPQGIISNQARRAACDNCHAQKLRCTKTTDRSVCVRCHRLNRPCVWSPPGRSGRPAKRGMRRKCLRGTSLEDNDTQPDAGNLLEGPMEQHESVHIPGQDSTFSDIFCLASPRSVRNDGSFQALCASDAVLTEYPAMADLFGGIDYPGQKNGPVDVQVSSSATVSDSALPSSLREVVQELSTLNMDLLDLNHSLHADPWGPMFESPSTVIATVTASRDGGRCDQFTASDYPLVEIFKKTQRFVEVVKLAPMLFSSRSDSSRAGSSTYSGDSSTSNGTSRQTEVNQQPNPGCSQSDLPTALLISACYARIIDLYTTIFTQMSHFVQALSTLSASGADYRSQMHRAIPPLQWGGFQPANYSALQMIMAVEVASFLLTKAERVLGVDLWERKVGGMSENAMQAGNSGKDEDCGLLSFALIEMVVRGGSRLGRIEVLRRMVREVKRDLESISL